MSLLDRLSSTSRRPAKRVGRGTGSGKGGHTAGRGSKGQRSRTGGKRPLWFEGGQLPLTKRLPLLRGKGRFKVVRPTAEVTLTDLNTMRSDWVTLETLKLEKVIDHRFNKAKIIKSGQLSRPVRIEGVAVSAGAAAQIEQAGGSVVTPE
ncbi:MAG: 50S ribosomal protein L15 [Candidatus Pacebacteria bacterium CG10_big_fil_rev_8_21_14_0_10_56_10]|nr:MAG: 50S ribosomal protein L15 [Candidatus Pacebacteria bacterium CG10_big_fil_rev_8_21_14_0_10_56_10]